MAKIIKATQTEKRDYKNGVYPLYGFVVESRNGIRCAVEYLGEGPGAPNYEVLAPSGMVFLPDGVHSILCVTLADVRERFSGNDLVSEEVSQ